jgi:hypothetical protein
MVVPLFTFVIPAQAGIQEAGASMTLDAGLRRNDGQNMCDV